MRKAKGIRSIQGACITALAIGLVAVAANCYADTINSTAETRAELPELPETQEMQNK